MQFRNGLISNGNVHGILNAWKRFVGVKVDSFKFGVALKYQILSAVKTNWVPVSVKDGHSLKKNI